MSGSPPKPLRWGVLGAARILRRLGPAIRSTGGTIAAIGASRHDRALEAAAAHGVDRAHAGYEAVLADDEVEAVYLPLANGLHRDWLLAIADAGKPCLCEKPLVLSSGDAVEVTNRFRSAGLRLQEAFMWRHHPQARWLRERFVAGDLGEVRRVHASFSFTLDRPDDYRWKESMGGGAILDIGSYAMNAARFFLDAEPVAASVRAALRPGDDGVDESAAGWVDFGGGRGATFSCSFVAAFSQGLEILGTEGSARIDRPWLSVDEPATVRIERGYDRETKVFEPADAYRTMVEHFTQLVRDPQAEMGLAEDGLDQARAMDTLLTSARADGAIRPIQGASPR